MAADFCSVSMRCRSLLFLNERLENGDAKLIQNPQNDKQRHICLVTIFISNLCIPEILFVGSWMAFHGRKIHLNQSQYIALISIMYLQALSVKLWMHTKKFPVWHMLEKEHSVVQIIYPLSAKQCSETLPLFCINVFHFQQMLISSYPSHLYVCMFEFFKIFVIIET